MITKIIKYRLLFILLLAGFGVSVNSSEPNDTDKQKIFVSIPPLSFFAERIGENNFEIITIIGPGQSPATFETTPKRLAEFSKGNLFFTAGVPFEKHLTRKLKDTFEDLTIIDTQKDIRRQKLEQHHHHGENQADESNSLDPHTWLDPSLAKIMAQNIYDGLIRIDPSDSTVYQKNLKLLIADIDKTDSYIKLKLKPFKGRSFYCFHPAFGYFAKAYDLGQISIEVDGKEPSARQLAEIIKQAKKDKVEILFIQPQFSDKSARAIAEAVGAKVVPIDPLAKDYLNNLKEITNQLVPAFERKKP